MGLFDRISTAAKLTSASNVVPFRSKNRGTVGVISPWQEGTLAPVIASDIWGLNAVPMTKLEMLRIPAVVKGRAILHSIISRPLRARDAQGNWLTDDRQPTWLYRTNTGVSPQMRVKLILDDFIFHGSALLQCDLGASIPDAPQRKNILDAWHVDYDRWSVETDENGVRIDIDGARVDQNALLWIPGPGPGLLTTAAELARGSRRTAAAWVGRVENPFPLMELHETEDTQMTDEEVADWLRATADARAVDKGAFFTPYNIEAKSHAGDHIDMFEDGRNAERIDWANFLNLPVSLLDGSTSASTLTYSTKEGDRNEVSDYTVPYWLDPLTSRLSLDDIVPAGTSVDMDFTDLLTPTANPAGPREQD